MQEKLVFKKYICPTPMVITFAIIKQQFQEPVFSCGNTIISQTSFLSAVLAYRPSGTVEVAGCPTTSCSRSFATVSATPYQRPTDPHISSGFTSLDQRLDNLNRIERDKWNRSQDERRYMLVLDVLVRKRPPFDGLTMTMMVLE